jgi:hypothetical protein
MANPIIDADASPVPARVIALPGRATDEDRPVPSKPLAQLEAEICELAGHIAAATCRWLLLVAEFDRRDGWAVDGVLSMSHWLSWRCGLGLVTAREHVRVARALVNLPSIRDAFMMGRLSYSKVRALIRVATLSNENVLLYVAQHATGAQVERVVSAYRRTSRLQEEQESPHDHFLRWEYDEDGCVVGQFRLPPMGGATLVKALEASRDGLHAVTAEAGDVESALIGPHDSAESSYPQVETGQDPSDGVASELPIRRSREERDRTSGVLGADALVRMAERALDAFVGGADSNERHLVLVHVDIPTLRTEQADDDSLCELNSGWAINPTLVRMLTCDGSVVRTIVDADGKVLDIGRKNRVVSKRLDRALKCRDRHCRFPGCTNAVYSWHHVKHWADDGPTDKSNLIGLCKAHHHAIHEQHFKVITAGDEVFRFYRPDMTAIPDVPAAPDVWGGLEEQQTHLAIDGDTVGGIWQGDELDLDAALFALQPRQEQAAVS